MRDLPLKTCPTYGRDFGWRRKWARHWDEVHYCSGACRRGRRSTTFQLR